MNDKLLETIYEELKGIGLPTDVDIKLRGYSKSYFGTYDPNTKRIIVYILDEEGNVYPKEEYMDTIIHEMIHHYQWQHTDYQRVKGVMHNPQFYKLFNKYMKIWRFKYGRNTN